MMKSELNDEEKEEELKKLSFTILHSILKSDDVKKALQDASRCGALSGDSPLLIFIEMNQVQHLVGSDEDEIFPPMIEGKLLSFEDELLEEYLQERFNSESWLRSLRITVDFKVHDEE